MTAGDLNLTVVPAYPTHGANWNDYVENNETKIYTATETACNADGTIDGGTRNGQAGLGYDNCVHAGEIRKVVVAGATSCASLVLTESLGAFDWICDDTGPSVAFYSTQLKQGKGLKDLVDGAAWKNNYVTLTGNQSGVPFGDSSPPSAWWSNPVVPLPNNAAVPPPSLLLLDGTDDDGAGPDAVFQPGTIFTVAANQDTVGVALGLSGMALVTLGSATLRYIGGAVNNCDGATGLPVGGRACLVSLPGQNYLWVEGSYDGQGGPDEIRNFFITGARFWRAQNLKSFNAGDATSGNPGGYGLRIYNSHYGTAQDVEVFTNNNGVLVSSGASMNRLRRLRAYRNFKGVNLHEASDNLFYDLRLIGNYDSGLEIFRASSPIRNKFVKITSSHNRGKGIFVDKTGAYLPTKNIFVDILAHSNRAHGVSMTGDQNMISHLSSIHNDEGLVFVQATNQAASQILLARNVPDTLTGYANLYLYDNSDNNRIANLVSYGSGNHEIRFSSTSGGNIFERNLLLGGPSGLKCDRVGSSNNNIATTTCAPEGPNGPLLNLVTTSLDLDGTNSLLEAPVADEPANADNAAIVLGLGVVNVANITDWFNFSHRFRGWAKGVNTNFWDLTVATGDCTGAENCVLRDYRLDKDASIIRNTSFDGLNPNSPFVTGAACPAAVQGSITMTVDEFTYLVNAVEIMEDDEGNENGLCESNEACLYSPNFGAYQGEGDYMSQGTCTFSPGIVTGVSMYAYPINGG